jgi:hypothetical protein
MWLSDSDSQRNIDAAGGVFMARPGSCWSLWPVVSGAKELGTQLYRRYVESAAVNGDAIACETHELVGLGAAERLARLLSDPSRLATEVLASWHNHPIEATLLRRTHAILRADPFYAITPIVDVTASPSLVDLLQSPEDAPVQHRHVRMTTTRGVVGDAYASVLMDEIAEEERRALSNTDKMLGRSLQARGVRRFRISLSFSTPVSADLGGEFVNAQAVLYRGSRPLAFVQETFFPRPIPANRQITKTRSECSARQRYSHD